jgi:serine/threonine-protein kinase
MSDILGQTLLSQYRVDAFIAAGGMGAVYRVWDLKRNVPLAMKVLHSELAEDPSVFKRFQREGRALQKLAHPNIVPFYGLYQTMDMAFMLERFVDGPSLKEALKHRKGQPLPSEEALPYFKALCAALGYAHANGVVHCDVKPGNVMIDRGGNIYLTDFGIARHAESSTTTIGPAGTAAYMPPEQITGEPVTPATDVYALGIILYEMVTGRRPFRGGETGTGQSGDTLSVRIRQEQLHAQAPDPRAFVADIPEAVSLVILRALNKKPEERFASAPEFFEAVCSAYGVSSASVKDRVLLPALTAATDLTIGEEVIKGAEPEKEEKESKRTVIGVWGFAVIGILGCIVLGAIALLAFGGDGSPLSRLFQEPTLTPTLTATLRPTITPSPTRASTPTITPTPLPQAGDLATNPIDGLKVVYIPEGTFTMGASDNIQGSQACITPQHKVTLDAYWINQTEVTVAAFRKFAGQTGYTTDAEKKGNDGWVWNFKFNNWREMSGQDSGPNWMRPQGGKKEVTGQEDHPVVQISWNDAAAYCEWAGGRLPTEAEWERAARGDEDTRIYPWGGNQLQGNLLNFGEKSFFCQYCDVHIDDGFKFTAPVGSFPDGASPFGLLDMAGNAYEWVQDSYDGYSCYSGGSQANPVPPEGGKYRIMRGGSYVNFEDFYWKLRVDSRWSQFPGSSIADVGIRCVFDEQPR